MKLPNGKAPVHDWTGALKPGKQIQPGFGPSFHGGSETASEWQVSWLQGHLTNHAFPGFIPVAYCGFHHLLQLRDSEGITPSSLLTERCKARHQNRMVN